MPKYLLLKHYAGGPEPHSDFSTMDEWTEDEINAHIAFQRHVGDLLRERGEFVDAQALSPEGAYVRYGGPDAAPVTTDGPFPEAKELVAGWFMIDVESEQRAHEIAAYVSAAPGKDGQPIYEWIEVRPLLGDAPAVTE
ncbi:MAG TPA: YciI family protein [Jatrophihabitans sp.]|nr:YciI family protein [Jatrophihabitans sp.]